MAIPSTIPRQIINTGSYLDDPTAETVYTAFNKTNLNFATVWKLLENQGYEKFRLDLDGITTNGVPEPKYIADAIERGRFVGGSYGGIWTVQELGRKPLFYTITPSSSNLSGIPSISQGYDYRFYRVHKKGQVFGGSGGVEITSDDVSPAGKYSVNPVTPDPGTPDSYIDLGNIGTSDVWTAFNLGKPAPDLGDEWWIKGLSLVTAVQGGNTRIWSFVGNQRLDIDEGLWGGDDILNPNYLAGTSDDFDLLSNQPVVFPDLYVSKTSRQYRMYDVIDVGNTSLNLTPEFTAFSINVSSGSGNIGGFTNISSGAIPIYDGMDIYVKNRGTNDVTLLNGIGIIPFYFANGFDLVLKQNEIIHFKYNKTDNRVEQLLRSDVDGVGNIPIPFGNLRILKIETNTNDAVIEAGDVVTASMLNDKVFLTFGEYVSGDPMDESSYDPLTIDKYDL